jgi:RNA ligase (TIGR02306 family)
MDSLVYIGKIKELQPISGADFIVSATVDCGKGGRWKGIVRKSDFNFQDLCVVFLPDSQLDPETHSYLPFMKDSSWRVKMRRFKGVPSEVLIIPLREIDVDPYQGQDVTDRYKVFKYIKPIPAHLQGIAKGDFPDFIPKTDEPNYQREPELVNSLIGHPWYMTEKADGSSTTAYKWKGQFGICSRNLELERNPENGYWKVAQKYQVEEKLPEGIAIQWETCGPGIQGNPMGLEEIDGFMFSAYNIPERVYLEFHELHKLSTEIGFPLCRLIEWGNTFMPHGLGIRGEGKYKNGKPAEGVVIRSQKNLLGHKPISFKVINLEYEK